jgi:hypothetical protein
MKTILARLAAAAACALLVIASCSLKNVSSVTVPFTLDHNRMLVDAEIRKKDGTWRKALLWVDTGNPDFFISESCASDLGRVAQPGGEKAESQPSVAVRIGGMPLNFEGVEPKVLSEPKWLFSTMHNDANLPSTVLRRYRVVFDYPQKLLTIAGPGKVKPRGERAMARVHPKTGIVQIDALVDGDSLSFALDNGASYSFMNKEIVKAFSKKHPEWPRCSGAVGCANIWGFWPEEPSWPVLRLPEILWGAVRLDHVGTAGVPDFFPNGLSLGAWYSMKTARPVQGILGPNAYKNFRVEIDYANGAVYFEKSGDCDSLEMSLVGLTLRPDPDGGYIVIGAAGKNGKPVVKGVKPGDKLIRVDDHAVRGATMGNVVDRLRGRPGDVRRLMLDRNGTQICVKARVEDFLPF